MSTTQAPTLDGTPKNECLGRLPIIETPYTRLTEHWFTWQGGPCADAELDFMMCSARVGAKLAETECKKYHDDFIECAYRIKTVLSVACDGIFVFKDEFYY